MKFAKAMLFLPLFLILVAGRMTACSNSPATATLPAPTSAFATPDVTSSTPSTSGLPSTPDRVDIVYFYRRNPCHCMQVVQDNIEYAVKTYFKDELDSGKLTFRMLVSDDKANVDTVRKYRAGSFGLFISIVKGNVESIHIVDGVWRVMSDKEKTVEYMRGIIEKSLRGEIEDEII